MNQLKTVIMTCIYAAMAIAVLLVGLFGGMLLAVIAAVVGIAFILAVLFYDDSPDDNHNDPTSLV